MSICPGHCRVVCSAAGINTKQRRQAKKTIPSAFQLAGSDGRVVSTSLISMNFKKQHRFIKSRYPRAASGSAKHLALHTLQLSAHKDEGGSLSTHLRVCRPIARYGSDVKILALRSKSLWSQTPWPCGRQLTQALWLSQTKASCCAIGRRAGQAGQGDSYQALISLASHLGA